MEDVNTGWKMATGIVIMCFVMSIGLSILWISRAFWNRTELRVETAVVSTADAEIYQLASQGRPTPLAAMWKCIEAVTPDDRYGNPTLKSFTLMAPCAASDPDNDGTGYKVISTDFASLKENLDKKGYISYSEEAGLYSVTVHLAK